MEDFIIFLQVMSIRTASISSYEKARSPQEKKLELLHHITIRSLEALSIEQILLSFIESEQDYFSYSLEPLNHLVQELRRAKIHGIDDACIIKMFVNIESIHTLHSVILRDLSEAYKQGVLLQRLGDIMIELLPFFKLYGIYLNGIKEASTFYHNKAKSNGKFQNLLRDSYAKTGVRVSLMQDAPLTRLAHYIMYFTVLRQKLAEQQDPNEESMQRALKSFHNTISTLASSLKDKLAREAVVTMQEEVFKNSIVLIDPARLLVKRGKFNIVVLPSSHSKFSFGKGKAYKREEVYAALFNDMLLLLTTKMKVRKIIRARSMIVDVVPYGSIDSVTEALRIVDVRSVTVIECQNSDCLADWLSALQSTIETQQSTLVGEHISDEYFENMILKKVPVIPLVDSSRIMRQVRLNKMNDYQHLEEKLDSYRESLSSSKRSASESIKVNEVFPLPAPRKLPPKKDPPELSTIKVMRETAKFKDSDVNVVEKRASSTSSGKVSTGTPSQKKVSWDKDTYAPCQPKEQWISGYDQEEFVDNAEYPMLPMDKQEDIQDYLLYENQSYPRANYEYADESQYYEQENGNGPYASRAPEQYHDESEFQNDFHKILQESSNSPKTESKPDENWEEQENEANFYSEYYPQDGAFYSKDYYTPVENSGKKPKQLLQDENWEMEQQYYSNSYPQEDSNYYYNEYYPDYEQSEQEDPPIHPIAPPAPSLNQTLSDSSKAKIFIKPETKQEPEQSKRGSFRTELAQALSRYHDVVKSQQVSNFEDDSF
jgi:hypothetical protein